MHERSAHTIKVESDDCQQTNIKYKDLEGTPSFKENGKSGTFSQTGSGDGGDRPSGKNYHFFPFSLKGGVPNSGHVYVEYQCKLYIVQVNMDMSVILNVSPRWLVMVLISNLDSEPLFPMLTFIYYRL